MRRAGLDRSRRADGVGRGEGGQARPPMAAQTRAPEAPKVAYRASTSLITWAVIAQPSAHRAEVSGPHVHRSPPRPRSSAWAPPTPAPDSAPITARLAVSVR